MSNRDTSPETQIVHLNYVSGTIDKEIIEHCVDAFLERQADDRAPSTLPDIPISGKLVIRGKFTSERYWGHKELEIKDGVFRVSTPLEARRTHETNRHFRVFHTVDYRKAFTEREINVRPEQVDEFDFDETSLALGALGTLYLPEPLHGQTVENYTLASEYKKVLFEYGDRILTDRFTIWGGFDAQPS
jgi:hypothetical protein